jgi:hypothetical protein
MGAYVSDVGLNATMVDLPWPRRGLRDRSQLTSILRNHGYGCDTVLDLAAARASAELADMRFYSPWLVSLSLLTGLASRIRA